MTKLLFILLFLFGCESFGVFKHSHEGACVIFYINENGESIQKCTNRESLFICERTYSENYIYAFYDDTTCEEYCNSIEQECEYNH